METVSQDEVFYGESYSFIFFFKLPCKRLLFVLKNTQRAFLLLFGCKQVPSMKKFQQLNEHVCVFLFGNQ